LKFKALKRKIQFHYKKTPASEKAREKSTVFGDLIKREIYFLSLFACCDFRPEGNLVHSPGAGVFAVVVADPAHPDFAVLLV
jgi:hypothetical protein